MESEREACREWCVRTEPTRGCALKGAGSRCPGGRMKSVRLPVRLCPGPDAARGPPSPICPCDRARWCPRSADLSGRAAAGFPASIGVPPWLIDLECPFALGNRYVCSGAPGKLGTVEVFSPLPSVDIFIHLNRNHSASSFHLKSRCSATQCIILIRMKGMCSKTEAYGLN